MAGENLLESAPQNFVAAGQLAEGRQNAATRSQEVTQAPGMEASRNLSIQNTKDAQGENAIKLQLLKAKMGETEVPPELAMQMAKDFGDPDMLHMSGVPMNVRTLGAFVSMKYKMKAESEKPRVTQIANEDGTVQNAYTWKDETGQVVTVPLGSGIKPEKLHPHAPRAAGKDHASDDDFKKKKEFNRAYEKMRTTYIDPIRAKEIQKTDPEKFNVDQQWLKDNADTYDTNVRAMGRGNTPAAAPAGGAPAAAPDGDAPFDADSFIRSALGD